MTRKEELESRRQKRGHAGLTTDEHKELYELRHGKVQHVGDIASGAEAEEIPSINDDDGGEFDT